MRISVLFALSVLSFLPLTTNADWPEFRGPWSNGLASKPGDAKPLGLPLRWSETENVKWKTAIHDRGWSTPVIMGGQVWITTATIDGHDFYAICLDAETGKIVHDLKLFHHDKPESLGNGAGVNCYASPSPAIEPGRVYVHFGTYGTACLDTATGKVIWQRTDLNCRHYRGPASSVILFNDLLIVTLDGVDLQYVVGLNKKTGETVWKTKRNVEYKDIGSDGKPKMDGDERKGFGTPVITEVGGKPLMISGAASAVFGYDPQTGREIWKARIAGHSHSARPVIGQGLAFISTGFGHTEMMAIRIDGQGDVTDTHVAWKSIKGATKMPSPVLVDDLLYVVSDGGVVTCWEAGTGKEVWTQRVGGQFYASLLYADGRIYCCNHEGKTTVLKAGRKTEVLATNTLADGFMASPAVSGKALFLRTKTNLYRIEEGAKDAKND